VLNVEQQQLIKKKARLRPRFFSMILIIAITVLSVYFVWYGNRNQLPNLHGWASTDVLTFAADNDIEVIFEFVYSDTVAPTLVSSQSVQPGTMMTDDMVVMVEISKGTKVR
jgi:beta-lactam-binding protein with PASTA domain